MTGNDRKCRTAPTALESECSLGAHRRLRRTSERQVLDVARLEEAIIHRDELAKLLGLQSPQMLDVHAREGRLVRADRRGWFKLAASITAMAEHQRSVAANHRSGDGKHDVA